MFVLVYDMYVCLSVCLFVRLLSFCIYIPVYSISCVVTGVGVFACFNFINDNSDGMGCVCVCVGYEMVSLLWKGLAMVGFGVECVCWVWFGYLWIWFGLGRGYVSESGCLVSKFVMGWSGMVCLGRECE